MSDYKLEDLIPYTREDYVMLQLEKDLFLPALAGNRRVTMREMPVPDHIQPLLVAFHEKFQRPPTQEDVEAWLHSGAVGTMPAIARPVLLGKLTLSEDKRTLVFEYQIEGDTVFKTVLHPSDITFISWAEVRLIQT